MRKHVITNDPAKMPFGDYVIFWLDSNGGHGSSHATAQAAFDALEREYPGEPVEVDIQHERP